MQRDFEALPNENRKSYVSRWMQARALIRNLMAVACSDPEKQAVQRTLSLGDAVKEHLEKGGTNESRVKEDESRLTIALQDFEAKRSILQRAESNLLEYERLGNKAMFDQTKAEIKGLKKDLKDAEKAVKKAGKSKEKIKIKTKNGKTKIKVKRK